MASLSPSTIRVVAVEDDPAFGRALAQAIAAAPDLQLTGIATSKSQALSLLAGPPADVLLVDLGLPDGSGIDVIRAAQDRWPKCDVVVSTAFGDEQHVLAAVQAGAAGYLLKDTPAERVVQEIRSVRSGESPISPLIARRVLQLLRQPAAASQPQPEPELDARLLSAREAEVLRLVSVGFTYEEVAQRLRISRHTVLTFIRRIYAKLEVNSKMEAVNEARRKGLLGP
jgi:DNA-binding NarL/FixJ family response regulator